MWFKVFVSLTFLLFSTVACSLIIHFVIFYKNGNEKNVSSSTLFRQFARTQTRTRPPASPSSVTHQRVTTLLRMVVCFFFLCCFRHKKLECVTELTAHIQPKTEKLALFSIFSEKNIFWKSLFIFRFFVLLINVEECLCFVFSFDDFRVGCVCVVLFTYMLPTALTLFSVFFSLFTSLTSSSE